MAKQIGNKTALDAFLRMVANCRKQVAGIVSPSTVGAPFASELDISLIFSPSQLLFWRINDSLLPTLHGCEKSCYPADAVSRLEDAMSELLDYASPAIDKRFIKTVQMAWRKFITPLQKYSKPTARKIEADRKRLCAFLSVFKALNVHQDKSAAINRREKVTNEDLMQKMDSLEAGVLIASAKIRADVQSEGEKTRSAIKKKQGQNRERFSEAIQEEAHSIWMRYRADKNISPSNPGRKLKHEDVFKYAKRELAAFSEPIITIQDFKRCLRARSDRIRRNNLKAANQGSSGI